MTIRGLGLLPKCRRDIRSSGMLHSECRLLFTDVSEQTVCYSFKVQLVKIHESQQINSLFSGGCRLWVLIVSGGWKVISEVTGMGLLAG
jgi:hypothetical protein